jgi:uncharacterized protein DUF2188
MANVHVVPEGGQWAVKLAGSDQPISTHASQNEAEEAGRARAKQEMSELLIHGEDGQIRARDSYGNDPTSSKG